MRLKELRKESGKTQLEIANYLSINQSNYGKYELGKIEPNLEILYKLADLYKVSLDYLVGRDFMDELGYLNKNEKELILMFRQMNQDNQLMYFAEAKGILLAQN